MSKTNGEGGEKKFQKNFGKRKRKRTIMTHPRFNY
jgi:hypothetical protein